MYKTQKDNNNALRIHKLRKQLRMAGVRFVLQTHTTEVRASAFEFATRLIHQTGSIGRNCSRTRCTCRVIPRAMLKMIDIQQQTRVQIIIIRFERIGVFVTGEFEVKTVATNP